MTYLEFIENGGELFPDDMYPTNKTFFSTINYGRSK